MGEFINKKSDRMHLNNIKNEQKSKNTDQLWARIQVSKNTSVGQWDYAKAKDRKYRNEDYTVGRRVS